MLYAIYCTKTGRIDRMVTCPEAQAEAQAEAGEAVLSVPYGVEDISHYIDLLGSDGHAVSEREPLQYSMAVQGLSVCFDSLPIGTLVDVGGQAVAADYGPTEVEFEVPGSYMVHLRPPAQYLEELLEVTVG